MAAEIACARRICHGSSSCSLRRHAGPLANAGVADERISGLLIKRRRLLEAVGLLELGKRVKCGYLRPTVMSKAHESSEIRRVAFRLRPPDPSRLSDLTVLVMK